MTGRGLAAAVAALLLFGQGLAAEAPRLRFGVMTDTHVSEDPASFDRVRLALKLFREKGCALIINNGDIAHRFSEAAYRTYRQVFDEAFASGPRPRELYVYAWHDAVQWRNRPRGEAEKTAKAAFADVRRFLRAPNDPVDRVEAGGCPFLVFPQFIGEAGFLSYADYERRIASACADFPGQPVFVVDHVPPKGTVCNSDNLGDPKRMEVLSRYPQVVNLTGHVHGTLRTDLLLWQGAFTVINAGCLKSWDGLVSGCSEPSHPAYGVLIIDVFNDRLEIRRWDVRDGSEINPESRWILPWPFAASTAPYEPHRRAAAERPASFPPGAALSLHLLPEPGAGLSVSFPQAVSDVLKYRIDVAEKRNGRFEPAYWTEILSDFWQHPNDRTHQARTTLSGLLLTPDSEIRVTVCPIGQYGTKGFVLSAEMRVPSDLPLPTLVHACENPSRDLPFVRGFALEDREPTHCLPDKEGFFGPIGPTGARLRLPKGVFAGKCREAFDVVVGLRTIQPETGSSLRLTLPAADSCERMCAQHALPSGDSGPQRYVVTGWQPPTWTASDWDLGFEWGAEARVKIDFIRIYKGK